MNAKILGYTYKIVFSPPRENGGMTEAGSVITGKQVILVDGNQCKEAQMSSILHEAIEAINYSLALGLEHNKIMALEAGIYQFVVDNPHIFRKEVKE